MLPYLRLDKVICLDVLTFRHFFVRRLAATFVQNLFTNMKQPLSFLFLFVVAFNYQATAQMENTMYQVFEVDSVQTVQLEVAGEYQILGWAGNSILIETKVQIWNASREILGHLIKEGRYDLTTDSTAGPNAKHIRIYTRYLDRKPIKRMDGQKCLEIAVTKIFVPDTFIISDDRKGLTRKETVRTNK